MSIQELSFDEVNEVSGGIILTSFVVGTAIGFTAVGSVALAGAATAVGVGCAVRFVRVARGTNYVPACIYVNGRPVF